MASGGIGKLRSILWQDANAFRFEWKGSNGDEVYCCFCYHVKDPRYEGTLEEVIQAARDAGVQILCANGTHEADWDEVLAANMFMICPTTTTKLSDVRGT